MRERAKLRVNRGRCSELRKGASGDGQIMWNNLSLVYEGSGREGENKVKQMTGRGSVEIGQDGLEFRLWAKGNEV